MTHTEKATWIWYPGDFEIWLGNKFNNRRTARGAMFPPIWKQDSHWPTVVFSTQVDLREEEVVAVWTEGEFNFMLDGMLHSETSSPDTLWYEESDYYEGYRIRIPKGKHTLTFKIWNQKTPPALFVDGPTIKSDSHWQATFEDKIWIDEDGMAHGSGIYVAAGSWNFDAPGNLPSQYCLKWESLLPVSSEKVGKGTLYDFGQETFGILDFRFPTGDGTIHIYYGESREEALDKDHCETLDVTRIVHGRPLWTPHPSRSKAFRYVYIETTGTADFKLAMYYEYAPFKPERSGSFRCSDSEMNRIWEVATRTMDLTTREFFTDGIKRDRWVWSGDAIQSYLMNYYLRFDTECVKRTIRLLRGKDPVTAHVNTIMDYTFYWFKSILDFYLYTDDLDFVREMYPKMRSLMAYCLDRTDSDGMAEGKSDDWIFIDWVDFTMHKRGKVCFEQILFCKALETMSACAALLRDHPHPTPSQGCLTADDYARDVLRYDELAKQLRERILDVFWSENDGAFIHAIEEGKKNMMITKFPNMFAIIYGYATEEMSSAILRHVMLNPQVERITTPYMRFYELEALCMMGRQEDVLSEIKSYWGGMLREGATSFWEKYVPTEKGTQHLAMYGRRYGKSLCHAWGASPIYLLGRYFLGVRPTKAGYAEYEVRPVLGGLEWMEGDVPTPFGKIHVRMEKDMVMVRSDGGHGTLVIGDRRKPIPAGETVVRLKIED